MLRAPYSGISCQSGLYTAHFSSTRERSLYGYWRIYQLHQQWVSLCEHVRDIPNYGGQGEACTDAISARLWMAFESSEAIWTADDIQHTWHWQMIGTNNLCLKTECTLYTGIIISKSKMCINVILQLEIGGSRELFLVLSGSNFAFAIFSTIQSCEHL